VCRIVNKTVITLDKLIVWYEREFVPNRSIEGEVPRPPPSPPHPPVRVFCSRRLLPCLQSCTHRTGNNHKTYVVVQNHRCGGVTRQVLCGAWNRTPPRLLTSLAYTGVDMSHRQGKIYAQSPHKMAPVQWVIEREGFPMSTNRSHTEAATMPSTPPTVPNCRGHPHPLLHPSNCHCAL
jgi:hypothetical protein